MPDTDKKTLREKKRELESELKSIQNELDDSLDRVKSDVSSSLDPLEHIRRHPLPTVGISILIGFLIGKDGHEKSSNSSAPGDKLSSTLSYELKRLITRKGISFVSDYLEDMLKK